MKTVIVTFSLIFCISYQLESQARLTGDLKQRLEGKRYFSDIKDEVHSYFREEYSKLREVDSLSKRFLNRQHKFWTRWLLSCEGRLEPDGSIANWKKRMYEFELEEGAHLEHADSRASNSGWSLVGPTQVDEEDGIGRVLRLAFHPTNSQVVYAGTARGGLWRTANGGSSWSNISAYLPSLGISGIEIKADDPNTIYVLSGEGDDWFSGSSFFNYVSLSNGVFKTTDAGANWSATAPFEPGLEETRYVGFQMRQDPNNVNTYIVATSIGVYRTANGAASWTKAGFNDLSGNPISFSNHEFCAFDIEYKPGSSTTVYTGVRIKTISSGNIRFAFFRSTNSGVTFNEVDLSSDIDVGFLIRFEIGVTPDNPSLVFLLCGPGFLEDGDGSDDTMLGFLKSTNSGVSFTNIATEPDVFGYNPTVGPTIGNQCFYDMALAISPTNANYIFTGGLVVFRSTDGGFDFDGNTTYWTWEVGETIHPDVHDLKYNPLDGRLYAATDGGVFYTANNGGAWNPIFNGLSITQFYHAENDNENNKLWGGTQDNGVLEQVSGTEFFEFDAGDGYDVMTDNIVGNGNDSYWSTNGGIITSGNNGNYDITPPDPSMVGHGWALLDMHPTNEDYIYAGYMDAVWYSPTGGDDWETNGYFNRLDGGDVQGEWCMQTCMSNGTRIYTAGNNRMWRVDGIDFEEGGTGTLYNITPNLIEEGFPSNSTASIQKVTDILVHPSNSAILWVTAGGFTAGAKVFYSSNMGADWTNITYNLPNIPANCLLRDSNGNLYVGMDSGIYYLPAGEDGWIPYYTNLPRAPVTEMFFVTEYENPPGIFVPYIYAATFGRGIWRSQKFTECTPTLTLSSHLEGPRFYQVSNAITSSSLIDGYAGTDVHFHAGNSITLTTGFEGKHGIKFSGYIQPCNTGPVPLFTDTTTISRGSKDRYHWPAVVEEVRIVEGNLKVKINVREKGNYAVHVVTQEGIWEKELIALNEFGEGRLQYDFPLASLPRGFHHVAIFNKDTYVQSQEYDLR